MHKSFSKPLNFLNAPSIELLAQNLHYLHKVVTEQCIHFNSKPIQNLFTITFSKYGDYEYATIDSVEQLLLISADPRIFGVCCNVWPDPN